MHAPRCYHLQHVFTCSITFDIIYMLKSFNLCFIVFLYFLLPFHPRKQVVNDIQWNFNTIFWHLMKSQKLITVKCNCKQLLIKLQSLNRCKSSNCAWKFRVIFTKKLINKCLKVACSKNSRNPYYVNGLIVQTNWNAGLAADVGRGSHLAEPGGSKCGERTGQHELVSFPLVLSPRC